MNVCMVTYNLVNNGIGKVILTYSAELVQHGHAVTVLVGGPCEQEKVEEATACGLKVLQLPNKKTHTLDYFGALREALNMGRFDICHIHANSGMVFPELVVANNSSVAVIVCHCHSTGCEHPVLHRVLRHFVPLLCDCMFACSEDAGKWLFGDSNFIVLPNAFEFSKFLFDPQSRAALRDKYKIGEQTCVFGNVARLNPEKNHAFLIDIFSAFHAKHPDSLLMIAGGGPGESAVKSLVDSSPDRDSIMLLGNVTDPSKLYSAMDCFVFPSIHEGLGIVLVEAQLAGLECFVSSDVPNGACVSNRFHSISLSVPARDWAAEIETTVMRSHDRTEYDFLTEQLNWFDIHSGYHVLERAYKAAIAKGGEK